MIMTEIFILFNLFSGTQASWWWLVMFVLTDWSCWANFNKYLKLKYSAKIVGDKA